MGDRPSDESPFLNQKMGEEFPSWKKAFVRRTVYPLQTYRVAQKNAPTTWTHISHEAFKLSRWKSKHVKVQSISFLTMYTFMTMRAIEMVKMASWKKLAPKKSVQMHGKPHSA